MVLKKNKQNSEKKKILNETQHNEMEMKIKGKQQ